MLNLFLSNLVTYGVDQNVVINNGFGVLLLGREKKYRFFRYVNIAFLMLGICICSICMYFINEFVLLKFDILEIKIGVIVLIAGFYNFLISLLWGKMSKFGQYLYEKSCSFVFDLVFTIFVVMMIDLSLPLVEFFMSLASIILALFVTNFVLGVYIESINKSNLKICVRNVAARLYLVAVFAIFMFYLTKLI